MIESAEKDVQKKLDYVYHKEKSGKSQFPYSEKARHLTTAIRAGGAISAGTAGVVTLAMGKAFIKVCQMAACQLHYFCALRKAFIKVCQMVKLGKLSEAEITSSQGAAVMKTEFKKQIQKKKTRLRFKCAVCSRKIFPFRLTMPQFGFYNLWHRNAHAFQPHRNRL